MATYSAGSASIDVSPNLDRFAEQLRTRLDAINADFRVDVTADTTAARADLDRLVQQTRTVTIDANLDDAAALARLEALTRDRTVRVVVDSTGLVRAGSQADGAGRSLNRMSGVKFTALAAGIVTLVPALLGVAGAAGGAAAALGAIGAAGIVGSQGVGDAFKAIKAQSEEAGSAAADNSGQIIDAQNGVKDALHGVIEAQQGVEDAQRSAQQAQVALNDSYGEAARQLRDMNDQLIDAELNQESAAIAVARAREQQAKTNADPKSSQLDRAEADVRVRSAEQRYAESKTDTQDQRVDTTKANSAGVSGSQTVKDAQEKAVSANQGVTDAQYRLAQANEAVAKANRSLAEANNSVGGSADKVAAAMAKLSPSAQAFVRDMQSLGPSFTEFRKSVQEQLFSQLGTSVGDFVRNNLGGLQQGLGAIAGTLGGTIKQTLGDLTGEFRKLSANGDMQRFVTGVQQSMSGLSPFITGFTNMMVQMGATVGPTLGPFFASLGELFRTIGPPLAQLGATLITSLTAIMPTLGQFIAALSAGLGPVLPVLAQLIGALGQAIIPLIAPLSQMLQIVGNALAAALPIVTPFLTQFAQLIGQILAAVLPLLPPLLQLASAILMPLVGIISQVVAALAPFITQLVSALQPVIVALTPVLEQMGTQIGAALVQALQTLMPLMMPFIQQFMNLFTALMPLLPALIQIAVQLLPLMLTGIRVILPILTTWITLFTQIAQAVMPFVVSALQFVADKVGSLAGVVDGFLNTWNSVMTGVQTAITGAKDWIVARFNDVVGFVTGLGARIKQAAGGIWDFLIVGLKDVVHDIGKTLAKIQIKIPDWVPGVGGKEFGFKAVGEAMQRLSSGGTVTGPGTGTSDSIMGISAAGVPTAMVSNGEFVVNASATSQWLPLLSAINSGLPGFAEGGVVGEANATKGMDFARSMDPATYLMGGFSRQQIDCSGMVAAVVNVLQGRDPFDSRMSTVTEGQWLTDRGFQLGTGGGSDVQIGWYDQGGGANGHTAMAIRGTNIESNGDEGVVIGGSTGPLSSMFTDHAFMRLQPSGPLAQPALEGGSAATGTQTALNNNTDQLAATGGTSGTSTATSASTEGLSLPGVLAKAGTSLGNAILSGLGLENSIFSEGNVYNKAITDVANRPQPGSAGVNNTGNAPQGTVPTPTPSQPPTPPVIAAIASTGSPVKDAVKASLKPRGWDTGAEWDAVDFIVGKESGWNPTATNPSSGAFGLFQFLGSTLSAYLPDRAADPGKQGVAGGRYINDRYQTPTRAREFWQSHQWYANGGPVSGPGGPRDDAIPAFLSNGEYVVQSQFAQQNRPLLDAINAGQPLSATGGGSRVSTDRSINLNIGGSVMDMQAIVEAVNHAQTMATMGTV